MIHIRCPHWGGGGLRQKWDIIERRGWGVSKCFGRPIFIFLLKKIGFAPWPGIMLIVLARNFPFDPDVRHWSYSLMETLRCLWVKLNNRMRDQFDKVKRVVEMWTLMDKRGGEILKIRQFSWTSYVYRP